MGGSVVSYWGRHNAKEEIKDKKVEEGFLFGRHELSCLELTLVVLMGKKKKSCCSFKQQLRCLFGDRVELGFFVHVRDEPVAVLAEQILNDGLDQVPQGSYIGLIGFWHRVMQFGEAVRVDALAGEPGPVDPDRLAVNLCALLEEA